MLQPAGPNEALWRVLPAAMANAALGLTNTALDVVAVADKPLLRSPLATRSSGFAAAGKCLA